MNTLVNFLFFQAGWFATVLGAANGWPWLGPVVVLAAVLLHLRSVGRPRAELPLIAIAVGLGLVADSLVLATGWIAYPNGFWLPAVAPYWIVSLWALFASTLNVSLRWLKDRYLLAAIFGGIGGPLSYLAGARLGAMTFIEPVAAMAALAVLWTLAMPALVWLGSRMDGTRMPGHPPYVFDRLEPGGSRV